MIQVLIAEVTLRNTDEFGVELGLQDSVLFDRSLLGNLSRTTTTTPAVDALGHHHQHEQNIVPAATLDPGSSSTASTWATAAAARPLPSRSWSAARGSPTSTSAAINNELGFGGLVLSASSESVSVLIRALQESQRLEVLGRPQIMTLDNQPAFIQVGKRVPRITGTADQPDRPAQHDRAGERGPDPRASRRGSAPTAWSSWRSTPRSPSSGREAEGIPVSIIGNSRDPLAEHQHHHGPDHGQRRRRRDDRPRRADHQEQHQTIERKVPYLADMPVLGQPVQVQLQADDSGRSC